MWKLWKLWEGKKIKIQTFCVLNIICRAEAESMWMKASDPQTDKKTVSVLKSTLDPTVRVFTPACFKYKYKPVKEDELEPVVGEVVEKVEDVEPGWWNGISRGCS